MRKLTAGLFITLDGVVESPQTWHFPYINDEVMRAVAAQTEGADTMLMGRRTYQEWAGYWPHQGDDVPFASAINGISKLVVSTTLTTVDWQNCRLIDADVVTDITARKAGAGGAIAVAGSPSLVAYLLEHDLLDELNLLVHPLVLGRGRRLFPAETNTVRMQLVRSTPFENGVLDLMYRPIKETTGRETRQGRAEHEQEVG
jgi:dihydrofolate reductase